MKAKLQKPITAKSEFFKSLTTGMLYATGLAIFFGLIVGEENSWSSFDSISSFVLPMLKMKVGTTLAATAVGCFIAQIMKAWPFEELL